MATYEKSTHILKPLAEKIMQRFATHEPLREAGVEIDYLFAYGARDEDGKLVGNALTKNGIKALGLTRKLSLKDRAAGRGDSEIVIDGDWWADANDDERNALLDHELHHIAVKANKSGVIQTDDLGRPQLRMRKHDVDVGWFAIIAQRHGAASQEQYQAKKIMDVAGQYFWPDLVAPSAKAIAK